MIHPPDCFSARQQRSASGLNAQIPNGRDFIAMLEAFRASGGAAPGSVLSRLLEEYRVRDPVSLAELVYAGQVFGFEWRANLWIPMFQFEAGDLAVKSSAQRVRAQLPLLSGWALALWFASPNALLHGDIPANVLDSDIEPVMAAARSAGSAELSWIPDSPALRPTVAQS